MVTFQTEMFVYDLASGEQKYKFPLDVGTVAGLSGRKEDTVLFYYFTSFVNPGQMFKCDMTGLSYESQVTHIPLLSLQYRHIVGFGYRLFCRSKSNETEQSWPCQLSDNLNVIVHFATKANQYRYYYIY